MLVALFVGRILCEILKIKLPSIRADLKGFVVGLVMIIVGGFVMYLALLSNAGIVWFFILLITINVLILIPSHMVFWKLIKNQKRKKPLIPPLIAIIFVFDVIFIFGKMCLH